MTEQTPPVLAERPPYFVAGLVALGALLLYVTTLAPTTQFWDSSEYMAAAHALGIPHPPGNPLFIILGHAWGLLPLGADYARRINLFAAVTSAAAAGLWFLIGRSEEHTSELQSPCNLVCRLLLEKKKKKCVCAIS